MTIGVGLGDGVQRHHHAIAADGGAVAGGLRRLGGDPQALDLFGFQGDAGLRLGFLGRGFFSSPPCLPQAAKASSSSAAKHRKFINPLMGKF